MESRSRDASEHPGYETERITSGEWNPFAIRKGTKRAAKNERRWWGLHFRLRQAKNERNSEAKRRQTQLSHFAVPSGTAAPPSGGAHLSAFHRGSGLGDRTPLPGFSSALPELVPLSGRYPRTGQPQCSDASRRPVVVPVGRNSQSRPGAGCKSATLHINSLDKISK
jgi:hypothetical protein